MSLLLMLLHQKSIPENSILFLIFNFYQSARRENKSNITIPYQIIFHFYLRINFFFIY